jgi:hypothetical protein
MIQKQSIALIGITTCVILSACSSSSPEKDGIKAAQKFCDCRDDMYESGIKTAELYIKNFNSYSFKTRSDAREKLNEIGKKIQEDFQNCHENATAYREEQRNKYVTNQENIEKFNYAFDAHGNNYVSKSQSSDGIDYQSTIDNLIKSIIPPKPEIDLERLKKDLLGRGIYKKGFYHDRPTNDNIPLYVIWGGYGITTDHLKEVKILNVIDKGDEYVLNVYLRLQGDIHGMTAYGTWVRPNQSFDGNVNVIYEIWDTSDNFEWRRKGIEAEY